MQVAVQKRSATGSGVQPPRADVSSPTSRLLVVVRDANALIGLGSLIQLALRYDAQNDFAARQVLVCHAFDVRRRNRQRFLIFAAEGTWIALIASAIRELKRFPEVGLE